MITSFAQEGYYLCVLVPHEGGFRILQRYCFFWNAVELLAILQEVPAFQSSSHFCRLSWSWRHTKSWAILHKEIWVRRVEQLSRTVKFGSAEDA
eukprot:1138583-Pelagomonas_calceolata.AAC.1